MRAVPVVSVNQVDYLQNLLLQVILSSAITYCLPRKNILDVSFREVDPFDLWIWLEFHTVPSEMEKQYVEEVFNSWFFLGKLGGFNAENLQVQDEGLELSYMNYDLDVAESSFQALMHNMGEVEYESTWARCWFDLGTSDAIALDILVNTFLQFSKDFVAIAQILIGGQNEDWPIESQRRSDVVGFDSDHN